MQQVLRLMLVALLLATGQTVLQQDETDCPGAPPTQLTVGEPGRVIPGPPLYLRDLPSPGGKLLGGIPGGETFDVLEGPVCNEGFNWWHVHYDELTGWGVEGTGTTYYLFPVIPPSPTATPLPVVDFVPPLPYNNQLAVGVRARVISDVPASKPLRLRLHESPGLDTTSVSLVLEGEMVTITDGPQEADSLRWWYLQADSGVRGWATEGQAGTDPARLPYERTLLALCPATDSDRVGFIGRQFLRDDLTNFAGYIYTAAPDGSNVCIFDRLKLAPAYPDWPVFNELPWQLIASPDGSQFAYVDHPDTEFLLYIMNQDGTRERITDRSNTYWVDWTPDGLRLLFTLGEGQTSDVWTQWSNGAARGALTSDDASRSWAGWLRDNASVVYIEQHGVYDTTLWTVNVETGGFHQLLQFSDDVRAMRLSPDRRYLFVSGYAQPPEPDTEATDGHTFVLDVESGEVVYEDDTSYIAPVWRSDSQAILAQTATDAADDAPVILHVLPVLGGNSVTLTTDIADDFTALRWLDATHLLIHTFSDNALTVLNTETGEIRSMQP